MPHPGAAVGGGGWTFTDASFGTMGKGSKWRLQLIPRAPRGGVIRKWRTVY